ncbi:MAG: hypothetical protein IJN04_00830 [Clostridia bacterium]|nr:hypothetical protein [Clostridia bacterium]
MARHNARQRSYEYEYGYHTDSDYKQRHQRNPRLRVLDTVLFVLVILLPLMGLAMWLAELPIPLFWLGIYTAVTQILAGALFLILTACGVGGFGKVGYFFTRTYGRRWMTTEEAKSNTILFGIIMLVIGVLVALLTLKGVGIL